MKVRRAPTQHQGDFSQQEQEHTRRDQLVLPSSVRQDMCAQVGQVGRRTLQTKSHLTPSVKSVVMSSTSNPHSLKFTFTQFLKVFAWI